MKTKTENTAIAPILPVRGWVSAASVLRTTVVWGSSLPAISPTMSKEPMTVLWKHLSEPTVSGEAGFKKKYEL